MSDNPLVEEGEMRKSREPCVLVIFGATGDLTRRKLFPAIYNLKREGALPTQFATVAFARRDKSDEEFRDEMKQGVCDYSRVKPLDENLWSTFEEQVFYHRSEFDDDAGYISLKKRLEQLDQKMGTKGNRVFYLSVQPTFFTTVSQKLKQHGLINDPDDENAPWTRVIIEKPFGHDLESSKALQEDLTESLDESQIYRIDHYLGKETVQNLLVFRFGNAIYESLWNNRYVDNVQITVAEDIGIGTRGRFWEEAGLLRDIVQNHAMQLLTLVAMEPPPSLKASAIRNEKVKVLESIRPILGEEIDKATCRGQYVKGFVDGDEVKGYRDEENVDPKSNVETYGAVRFFIDNWRWAGVPFYVRGGKRLPKRVTEIAITFKEAPGSIFGSNSPDVLAIRVQPDEGISLKMNTKVPGQAMEIRPVTMDFKYSSFFGLSPPDAYERLICDCIAGDNTLFAREDEVMHSWRLITPILERWAEQEELPTYSCGSWGPDEADQMLKENGHTWRTP